MDDSKVDGVIYRKAKGQYFRRNFGGSVDYRIFTGGLQEGIDTLSKLNEDIVIEVDGNVDLTGLQIPNNIRFKYYGPTNEDSQFGNNVNGDGTPVNEWRFQSPYHSGLILETFDSVNLSGGGNFETPTRRMSSVVIRRNGFSTYQKQHALFGKREHILNYVGNANITVNGGATATGTVIISLNNVEYPVGIVAGDTQADILNKILNVSYNDYWGRKVITSNVVKIFPMNHMYHIVKDTLPSDGDYSIEINGVTYNIPVLATDSRVDIAVKIAQSSIIPSDTYILYNAGAGVEIYLKSGGISGATKASVIQNTTGSNITTSVTGYVNTFNNVVSGSNGFVGVGMWMPSTRQLEVANSMTIVADSDNNMVQSTNAILELKNENAKESKLLRLISGGVLTIYDNSGSTQLLTLDDSGNFLVIGDITGNISKAVRYGFKNTSRFLTTNSLGAEFPLYISNNAGTGYIGRISDANRFEQNVGGTYIPLRASATTTQTGLVKQSEALTSPAPVAAAGANPTKAEFDAVVAYLNELKAKLTAAGIQA